MTAGKGIVHSEMINSDEPCKGLQLWVNLPKKHKMCEPKYQELKNAEIPQKSQDGVHVKVIAGESMGTISPVYTLTPTLYLEFKLDKGAKFNQPIPTEWNGFIYIIKGTGIFGDAQKETTATAHHTVILSKGHSVSFRNENSEQLQIILIAGQPINEPIVQHGPFVMNTDREIQQAISDFQNCRNGFENAKTWVSKNSKR